MIQQLPKKMYVPIVLVANMMGLSFPINAFKIQLTAVVKEELFARVLFKIGLLPVVVHIEGCSRLPHRVYFGADNPRTRSPRHGKKECIRYPSVM